MRPFLIWVLPTILTAWSPSVCYIFSSNTEKPTVSQINPAVPLLCCSPTPEHFPCPPDSRHLLWKTFSTSSLSEFLSPLHCLDGPVSYVFLVFCASPCIVFCFLALISPLVDYEIIEGSVCLFPLSFQNQSAQVITVNHNPLLN